VPEFYAELARLYRGACPWPRIVAGGLEVLWRGLVGRGLSLSHLRRLLVAARTLTDAGCYLAGHEGAQPGLSGV